ncbi:MAG TPA: type II secretion system F family protein [Vicinamibacterales bacterium]|jgi:tight adherence protein B|nr:type II secretion system F family protein [Vicinamibacterales bacterium]
MLLPLAIFVFVVALVMGTYAAITYLPGVLANREMDRRLRSVSGGLRLPDDPLEEGTVVRQDKQGPLPILDRVLSQSNLGAKLKRLIEQSGVDTSASAIVIACIGGAMFGFVVATMFTGQPFAAPLAAVGGLVAPIMWLKHKATRRLKKFEEMFPEALDLLSRAIRAGHAFQTAMGMVADELHDPVGPEFKKTFDQQNFGLPLKDALNGLAERIGLLDVRFFVTAVLIQRDTGGNLSEILDNLAHVVRERFKILRQVRVHTAHGRFTGYVLLAMPAFLACALMVINPEHMGLLFSERMGQLMVMGAIVLQAIGYFWIRQVIKIEV